MLNIINALPGAVAQGIIWGIMAMGVYITFRILDVADLTVDGSMATGGAVLAVCTAFGMNIWLALFLAFAAGCIAGFVTGLFCTKFGIPAILAGILTQLILYSVNLRIMSQRANVPLSVDKYDVILSLRNVPMAIVAGVVFVVVLIGIKYWFFGTEVGHAIRASGCNPNMARANGINTDKTTLMGLIISNGIVALSGALLTQYQGFADVNMGKGAIVIGLAAVIIGEVLLNRWFRNFALKLLAVVIGGVIYYIVMTLVLLAGMNANDLKMFSAIFVAIFLGLPFWKRKLAEMRSARRAE